MRFKDWLVDHIKSRVEDHYLRLSERYGSRAAKLIIAAALAGSLSPIPGSSLVAALPIVGMAELVKRFKEKGLKSGWLKDRVEEVREEIFD